MENLNYVKHFSKHFFFVKPNQLNVPIPVQLFEDQDQGASGNCGYSTEVNEHIENNSSAKNRIFSQDKMFQELVLDIVKM